jgi:hypothetical protein
MLLAWASTQPFAKESRSSLVNVDLRKGYGPGVDGSMKKPLQYAPWNGEFWFSYNDSTFLTFFRIIYTIIHKARLPRLAECFGFNNAIRMSFSPHAEASIRDYQRRWSCWLWRQTKEAETWVKWGSFRVSHVWMTVLHELEQELPSHPQLLKCLLTSTSGCSSVLESGGVGSKHAWQSPGLVPALTLPHVSRGQSSPVEAAVGHGTCPSDCQCLHPVYWYTVWLHMLCHH